MPDNIKLDILAIAAHPDDIEITCGGFLIKMAKRGRAVGALDLTRGEMGTYGDENDRDSEAAEAARVMGLSYRGNLEMKDSAVEVNQENKLKMLTSSGRLLLHASVSRGSMRSGIQRR